MTFADLIDKHWTAIAGAVVLVFVFAWLGGAFDA